MCVCVCVCVCVRACVRAPGRQARKASAHNMDAQVTSERMRSWAICTPLLCPPHAPAARLLTCCTSRAAVCAGGAAGRWGRAARYNDRRLPACRCARAPSCAVPGHPCELEAPASASRRQKRLACVLVRGVLRRLLRRPDLWRSSLKRVALSTISLDSALRQPASQQRAGWPTAG